jgi:GNAT superfamily N-acetyltransferase
MATFTVRAAGEADYPAAAAIRAQTNPDRIISAEGMTVFMADLPERARLATWLAEVDGVPAGWAMAMRAWSQPDDTIGMLDVVVHPHHQGSGIGGALAARAEEHCAAAGLTVVRATSPDGPGARALAGRLGYRETFASSTSSVDPRTVAPLPVPDDVELVTFGELDDPEPVFRLFLAVGRDVPGDESMESIALEDWVARFWHTLFADDECSLLARVGGVPAGLTMLRVDRPGHRAENNLTGVLRELRGRGLARLLKAHSLQRAAKAGVTRAVTVNDETNAPMLAVNRALGYRHLSRRVEWERVAGGA